MSASRWVAASSARGPSQCLRRAFSSTATTQDSLETTNNDGGVPPFVASATPSTERRYNPELVSSPRKERRLQRQGITPVGSRRKRAVLASLGKSAIPFEQLPYQCFQEARKILQQDREEKLELIRKERERIERLSANNVSAEGPKAESLKERRLESMRQHLHQLKILADINDPLVKKRFEDGEGDMGKPIYRHLAEKKWRKMRRLIAVQRIEQFKLVPDLLQACDPTVDLSFSFGERTIEPGAFVSSGITEQQAPVLNVQAFEAGERLVTVAIVDPDVPNVETNSFGYRCHYLAANIKISPTSPAIDLNTVKDVVMDWLAPWAQKGSPYHRLPIFVFEQQAPIDVAEARQRYPLRDGFKLRSLETKYRLKPLGATLFRSKHDESTDGVMRRLGVPEADTELFRNRVEPLPYKWKRGDGERYR